MTTKTIVRCSMTMRRAAMPWLGMGVAAGIGVAPLPAAASCGSAFCTINTQWDAQGVWAEPGLRADLRYEYVDQDQPRSGSRKVRVGELPRHHDEVETINRNLLAAVDYTFNSRWAVKVTLPVVDREHLHIHNHNGEQLPEAWDFTRLGDLRIVGRYQFAQANPVDPMPRAYGLTFGLKLPTGPFDVRNRDGDLAERSLQPGTGTTDLLLGAYYWRELPVPGMTWYAQGLYEYPLRERDGYKPGYRLGLDLGVRYEVGDRTAVMLQVNSLFRGRDSGAEAEREDSGGRGFFLSPGAAFAITDTLQAYFFYQHPLYQSVNGVQLTASKAFVIGVSGRI